MALGGEGKRGNILSKTSKFTESVRSNPPRGGSKKRQKQFEMTFEGKEKRGFKQGEGQAVVQND